MTFRPSDDVLEEMTNGQNPQAWTSQYNTYNNGYSGYNGAWGQIWQQDFQQTQNFGNGNQWNYTWVWNWESDPEAVLKALNIQIEEVKAPDLSDLLQNSPKKETTEQVTEQVVSDIPSDPVNNVQNIPVENTASVNNPTNNVTTGNVENDQIHEFSHSDLDLIDPGKTSDVERAFIIKSIEWSISSNLDFLVDEQWANAVSKYKKLYRILFKRWCLAIASITWLCLWVYAQMGINQTGDDIVKIYSIKNKDQRRDKTPSSKTFEELIASWVNLDIVVPYGLASSSVETKTFQSRSNLIKYNWIILPQLISVNYGSWDSISSEDFSNEKTTRKDIEKLVKNLITSKYNSKNLSIYSDRWVPNKFDGWLIEWFSLWCVNNYKVSDVLCDKALEKFYELGKYYELSNPQYSSEMLTLTKDLKGQWKDIEPICNMINEYVWRVGLTTDDFESIMQYCNGDEYVFYTKLVNFIELEKSLWQPELSDKVYDDPDLNAYKLLSARQTVYRIVWWTTLNENFLKSYLNYVQALINKDNKTNRYLAPIYKDMLYVFNTDYLYQTVLKNWKSDIKLQLDQINNGNSIYKYPWLISQLTTIDIVNPISELSWGDIQEVTIEDIFSQYYSMKDRLRIRSMSKISDNELLVKTELFTNKIFSVTDDKTLKLTLLLHRNGNVLYVNNIKVTDQPKLSEILNIQASNGNISFSAMLGIIDEQIWMWYKSDTEEDEVQPTFCETLQEREDLSIYACDDSTITLYKWEWEVEYNFELRNWVLSWYEISDENLNKLVHEKLGGVMFMKENTPTIIKSIIDFSVETTDDSLEKKLEIIDQFRIHFKLVPSVSNIEWETDKFLVDFTLWTFNLQAHYDINTHVLTKVSYVACDKTLEIRSLEIPITTENEPQLIEISNNPQAFFTKVNAAAYKKYQKMCEEDKETKK